MNHLEPSSESQDERRDDGAGNAAGNVVDIAGKGVEGTLEVANAAHDVRTCGSWLPDVDGSIDCAPGDCLPGDCSLGDCGVADCSPGCV